MTITTDSSRDLPGREAVAANLETFIRERFQVKPDDAFFGRGVNLWEEGYVDSAGIVEVISHLETTWGVRIPDDALFDPRFGTIEGMSETIEELRATSA
jgi:acyl carrier protein